MLPIGPLAIGLRHINASQRNVAMIAIFFAVLLSLGAGLLLF